jgi:hypothetical protein
MMRMGLVMDPGLRQNDDFPLSLTNSRRLVCAEHHSVLLGPE